MQAYAKAELPPLASEFRLAPVPSVVQASRSPLKAKPWCGLTGP
jgi:hypothetical protein